MLTYTHFPKEKRVKNRHYPPYHESCASVWQNAKFLLGKRSLSVMPDVAQLSQCCCHGHHLPACLLRNVSIASAVQLRCALQEGRHTKAGRTLTAQEPQLWPSPAGDVCPMFQPSLGHSDSTGSDHGAHQLSFIFGWAFTRLLCEVHYQIST